MSHPLTKAVVVTLIQVVLIFDQRSVEAEFSDTCDNSTVSFSCIHNYEQLYDSLKNSDNSFNIESALYPAKRPSSLRMFVNLHGPKKTGTPIARYTWSSSCLYVAVPTVFLEIVSLGSILVSHRTEELNLNIPDFCCNVSKTEEERRNTINHMIESVLAALQDLAISPERRDPRLNNVECVIEGHGIDIGATGRGLYIRILMWGSFCFTLASCKPLLMAIRGYMIFLRETRQERQFKAIQCFTTLVGILGSSIWLILLCYVIYYMARDRPIFYVEILIILIPVFYFILPLSKKRRELWAKWRQSYRLALTTWLVLVLPLSVIYISFCFCWVIIGIMLNPIWGLTVALAVYFTLSFSIYVVYTYLLIGQLESDRDEIKTSRILGVCTLVAATSLTLVTIFSGQSFNGRGTDDEILKTVLLGAVTSVTSWFSLKKVLNNSLNSGERQTQSALGVPSTDHSPNQSRSQSSSGESSSYRQTIVADVHESPFSETSQYTPSQLPIDDSLPVNYQTTTESQFVLSDSPGHETQPNDSSMRSRKSRN